MALMTWRPRYHTPMLAEMDHLFRSMRPFRRPTDEEDDLWNPAADVTEGSDVWTVDIDLPGVPRDKVRVTVADGTLTVEGERTPKTSAEGDVSFRSERAHGTFRRRFSLPDTVDPEKVAAEHKDGVLRIRLPKAETAKPREIEVAVA